MAALVEVNQKTRLMVIAALKMYRADQVIGELSDVDRLIEEITTGRTRIVAASDQTWRELYVNVTRT